MLLYVDVRDRISVQHATYKQEAAAPYSKQEFS
jgi:hypothetical protein